jgi:hypothetical protein
MGMTIDDGGGAGGVAKVTNIGRLKTQSESHSIQFQHALEDGENFQLNGFIDNGGSGTLNVLHVKNTSSSKIMAFTYIRAQGLGTGGTAIPNTNDYFQIVFGLTYSSGGTAVTAVNTNEVSGNVADITAYQNATLTGTASEVDKWFVESNGKEQKWNKEGALIIGQNQTLTLRHFNSQVTGEHSRGRFSFIQIAPEELE